ncbi:MAG: bifunctional phosphoribosylaminoimidazolecarboxamide formyltransferase/IMP cyclohydrolase [Chloroflexota bacterium]|nr:bifunctional phosphoribosylaminoimidazolecarboxamide formyltransferase/IMP cyclohydrolase [Chloroflexota bacterium]
MSAPRALLAVADKRGIDRLGAGLHALGWEVVASSGTAQALRDAGVPARSIDEVTGWPEMFDGRVKTLHPAIHAGILARSDLASDREQLAEHGLTPIDLVAVNLYPFAATLARTDHPAELVENIDIGGPAMIRAAAKNHDSVWTVTDPDDYERVLDAIENGEDGADLRRELAAKAFALTAFYEAHVAGYFQATAGDDFPHRLTVPLQKMQDLRYGENPHQRGAFYAAGDPELGHGALAGIEQLHGMELSYVNILDLQAAWAAANDHDRPAVAIVKHTNPCGLAVRDSLRDAYASAHAGDPLSAFGGIVGFNREIDIETVAAMKGHFYHVVVAPAYADDALRRLRRRKNLRIVRWSDPPERLPLRFESAHVWGLDRGYLVQDPDRSPGDDPEMRSVSAAPATDADVAELRFGMRVIRHVKSNAVVLVKVGMLVGVGVGQMNRVDAVRHAVTHAGAEAVGSYLVSDAYFPKTDGPEEALAAGVRAIAAPSGSIEDDAVVAAVDAHGGVLVFVGERHFKH